MTPFSGAKVLDLTHLIEEGMPVYPGTEPPSLRQANTLEKDGFRETLISMFSHTGTHMDAPAHILSGASTLDLMPPEQFFGRGVLLDATGRAGDRICMESLIPFAAAVESSDFLILRTGWDRLWGKETYFNDYPVLDTEAARWLAGRGLKGIGLDCISADPGDDAALPIHRILLDAGMVIIENLTNLHRLPAEVPDAFDIICLPLKIRDADGSPVRALAFLAD